VEHVDKFLQLLKEHQLVLKCSKCAFGDSEVEYLGHVVSKYGLQVDLEKVVSMKEWPRPKTLKNLRGFLGITGYYRKFVKNYGKTASPLTSLLKNHTFFMERSSIEGIFIFERCHVHDPTIISA